MPDIAFQGIGLGIVLSALGVAYRIMRRELSGQEKRLGVAEEDARTCNWRLEKIIDAARVAGIGIPPDIWGPPPWKQKP